MTACLLNQGLGPCCEPLLPPPPAALALWPADAQEALERKVPS